MEYESITGIVYVLTNPAMPGIVKIGKASRGLVDDRLNELYLIGSRQEEVQKLGRILRFKKDKNKAHFYTLVTAGTEEQEFALNW